MCDERRSTFSKVKIDEDGHSTTYYTSTLKRSTMIWSILAAVLAAIVSLIAIQAAVIAGIKDVADQVFDVKLSAFHAQAKPEIYREVAMMIQMHRSAGVHPGAMTEAQIVTVVGDLREDIASIRSDMTHLKDSSAAHTLLLQELLRSTNGD